MAISFTTFGTVSNPTRKAPFVPIASVALSASVLEFAETSSTKPAKSWPGVEPFRRRVHCRRMRRHGV